MQKNINMQIIRDYCIKIAMKTYGYGETINKRVYCVQLVNVPYWNFALTLNLRLNLSLKLSIDCYKLVLAIEP